MTNKEKAERQRRKDKVKRDFLETVSKMDRDELNRFLHQNSKPQKKFAVIKVKGIDQDG